MTEENAFGQPIGPVVPGWSGALPPAPVPLAGRTIGLVPLTVDHAPDLAVALADEPTWTYYAHHAPQDAEQMAEIIAANHAWPTSMPYAAVLPDGRAAGMLSLLRIDPPSGSIEVGWVVFGPRLRRTVESTEAVVLLARHVFDDLGYRRLEWKCDALNGPSMRAAERFGFVPEGVHRQATVTRGRNRDTAWFSILDVEWPARRAEYADWLDPANFDESGGQRRRLEEFRLGG